MAEVRLNDLVTGSFIKNTQRFSTTPHLIPVQVYVEGKDDICFWRKFLRKYDSKYVFNVVTNKVANNGDDGKEALMKISSLSLNKIVCVDADFDLLIDNYHTYTSLLRQGDFIINTEYYSIENILLRHESLYRFIHSIVQEMASFDFNDYLNKFSTAIYDLFLFLLCSLDCKSTDFGFKQFNDYINSISIRRDNYSDAFIKFSEDYHKDLKLEFQKYKTEMDKYDSILRTKGYLKYDTHKLLQGHILFNTVLKSLIVFECNVCKNQKVADIYKRTDIDILQKDSLKEEYNKSFGGYSSMHECIDAKFYACEYCDGDKVPQPVVAKLDALYS